MGLTISEKILAKASGRKKVAPGEFVNGKVDLSYLNDISPYIVNGFKETGIEKVHDPNKILIALEHRSPPHNMLTAKMHQMLREFAKEQGIKHFYDMGRQGVAHQIVAEKGFIRPGTVVVSHDTHATTQGALGCFANSIGFDLINTIATGATWWRVPESLKFNLTGSFGKGVMARDLIHRILGDLGPNGAAYKVMEFVGPAAEAMSIDGRKSMCCEVVFSGAKTGIFNTDQKIINHLKDRVKEPYEAVKSDPDAIYEESFDYDLSSLEPQVAKPHHPTNTTNIAEVEGIEIDQAVIASCASGRIEDLRIAAKILKGRKVHPRVKMYITPISQEIYLNAIGEGLLQIFNEAEAQQLPPSCTGCTQILVPGQVSIASVTHNHSMRHGKGSKTYLASPATVAASAVKGKISDPREFL